MVFLPEERVALWPWRNDCCDKSAITADDLHFWVEEPGAPQANLAEFFQTALMTVAYSAVCAVAASQTQQAEAEELQSLLRLQQSCHEDHEESAQSSALPASSILQRSAVGSRWADIAEEDNESDDGPGSGSFEKEFGQIQEVQSSEAHGAARHTLGDGESQVASESLPMVSTFFGSRSEPIENGTGFRPRWGDIDDSESDEQTVVHSNASKQQLLGNESRIQGEFDVAEQKADAAEVTEVAGQRRSKGSATRGKRGGVKRNAGRNAARSAASWDAASQKPNKPWDASASWQKGGWASSSSHQTSVWTTASWQQNGCAPAKTAGEATSWAHEWVPRPRKWQCQFIIGIEEEPIFRVVRRLLGPGGKNVKAIAEETGAKLRLRGLGSKFLEGPEKRESSDPLMMCISASTETGYNTAVDTVQDILQHIYTEYHEFQANNGMSISPISIQMHVGAREFF